MLAKAKPYFSDVNNRKTRPRSRWRLKGGQNVVRKGHNVCTPLYEGNHICACISFVVTWLWHCGDPYMTSSAHFYHCTRPPFELFRLLSIPSPFFALLTNSGLTDLHDIDGRQVHWPATSGVRLCSHRDKFHRDEKGMLLRLFGICLEPHFLMA